jgi:hypothetical protein
MVSVGTHATGQPGTQGPSNRELHQIATIDVVEGHDYSADTEPIPGYPDDRWNSIWGAMSDAVELNKPFFIGESGIIAGLDSSCEHTLDGRADLFAEKARATFEEGGVGYLYWSYSERASKQAACGYDMALDDPALEQVAAILADARSAGG